jgi:uncharacterized protein with GYD domain
MVIGVTAIKVVPGQERSAYQALKHRDGIEQIYHAFGEYDFFIVMQAEGMDNLNLLMENIQGMGQIARAQTIIVGTERDMMSAKAY